MLYYFEMREGRTLKLLLSDELTFAALMINLHLSAGT